MSDDIELLARRQMTLSQTKLRSEVSLARHLRLAESGSKHADHLLGPVACVENLLGLAKKRRLASVVANRTPFAIDDIGTACPRPCRRRDCGKTVSDGPLDQGSRRQRLARYGEGDRERPAGDEQASAGRPRASAAPGSSAPRAHSGGGLKWRGLH